KRCALITTERPFMSGNQGGSWNRDALLENFAAEVTSAAYAVALRHDVADKWLDLELELWEALKETVKKWDQGPAHFLHLIANTNVCPHKPVNEDGNVEAAL